MNAMLRLFLLPLLAAIGARAVDLPPWDADLHLILPHDRTPVSATKPSTDRTTPTLPAGRRETTATSIWFNAPDSTAGPSTLRVFVDDAAPGQPFVQIDYGYATKGSPYWQATSWLAALAASSSARLFPDERRFEIHAGGPTDGTSAGLLTAAMMLALLHDAPLLPDTTLIGGILPDGTAAPVDGLEQRLQTAQGQGVKRVGFPAAQITIPSHGGSAPVQVAALGGRIGLAETRPISTIEDAFEFLTGKRLPSQPPATQAEMALAPSLRLQFQTRSSASAKRISPRLQRVNERLPQSSNFFRQLVDDSVKQVSHSRSATRDHDSQGHAAAAYYEALRAEMGLRLLELQLIFIHPLLQDDLVSVNSQIKQLSEFRPVIEGFHSEMGHLSGLKTVGARLNSIDALGNYANAMTRVTVAESLLDEYARLTLALQQRKVQPVDRQQVFTNAIIQLNTALMNFAYARTIVDYGRDLCQVAGEEGPPSRVDPAKLAVLGKAHAAGAGAVIGAFDALVLQPEASRTRTSIEELRRQYAPREVDYPFAALASRDMADDNRCAGIPGAQRCGLGFQAMGNASTLLAKYEVLGLTRDARGQASLRHPDRLAAQVALSRQRALELVGRCRDVLGFVPSSCAEPFEIGSAITDSGMDGQFSALQNFWTCSISAQLALLLGR